MSFDKPIQRHLKGVSGEVCVELEAYQAVIYNKKLQLLRVGVEGWLRRSRIWPSLNSIWLSVNGLSNSCQVDGQLNVGETQMTKFSSNRPVKSTLTADQSLVKRALTLPCCLIVNQSISSHFLSYCFLSGLSLVTLCSWKTVRHAVHI